MRSLVGTVALRFRSGVEEHVALVEGSHPQAQPRGGNDPIPVLVGAETAQTLGVSAGARLALYTIGALSDLPTLVEVVGVARPAGRPRPVLVRQPPIPRSHRWRDVRAARAGGDVLRRRRRAAGQRRRVVRGELRHPRLGGARERRRPAHRARAHAHRRPRCAAGRPCRERPAGVTREGGRGHRPRPHRAHPTARAGRCRGRGVRRRPVGAARAGTPGSPGGARAARREPSATDGRRGGHGAPGRPRRAGARPAARGVERRRARPARRHRRVRGQRLAALRVDARGGAVRCYRRRCRVRAGPRPGGPRRSARSRGAEAAPRLAARSRWGRRRAATRRGGWRLLDADPRRPPLHRRWPRGGARSPAAARSRGAAAPGGRRRDGGCCRTSRDRSRAPRR